MVEGGETSGIERLAMQALHRSMQSRTRYEAGGKMAGVGSNVLAWFSGGTIKVLPGPFAGWTDSRNFPPFAKHSFRELWHDRTEAAQDHQRRSQLP